LRNENLAKRGKWLLLLDSLPKETEKNNFVAADRKQGRR